MSLIVELLGVRRICACGAPLPQGERFKDGRCGVCWLAKFREVEKP
jgi:hypothetical protein